MKSFIYCALALIATGLVSQPAHALFEARLTYGLLGSNPDLGAMFNTGASLPSLTPTYGLGADVIVSPPFFPIGFGLRYESMGVTASSSGNDFKANYTRTALLVNYRLIDTLLFLGPIFSYGLSHSGEIKVVQNGTETSNFSSSNMTSYSAGLEAGVKLVGLRLGAEVGYEDFRWKDAKDSHSNAANQDINMSGTYAKVLLGFGI
jgi:hypothetical protein